MEDQLARLSQQIEMSELLLAKLREEDDSALRGLVDDLERRLRELNELRARLDPGRPIDPD